MLSSPVIVTSTPLDLTPIYGALATTSFSPLVTYDSVNEVFKCDATTTFFYSFFVNIRISGDFSSTSRAELIFSIRRPDGVTEVTSVGFVRIGSSFTERTAAIIPTRVFPGGADNYQIDGFKIYIVSEIGPNFEFDTVNNQELIFEAT